MNRNPAHKSALNRKLISLAVASCFVAEWACANPTAPTVVHGAATIQQAGNLLSITNSPNAIINWGSFSIGASEITRFIQQSQASAVLNRVIGQNPSSILGALQSNGRVFLINPSGILFGAIAQIDVAGLVASTLNLSNDDFLAGRMRFTALPSGEGPGVRGIENHGNITTAQGGQVYLVAPDIKNTGIITSPKGEVVLAAGNSVELVNPGTPNLRVEITAPDNEARNLGQIVADSGRVGIYAGLINHSGTIRADSAVVGENGQILLKATKDVTLEASSVTSASGPQGGSISIEAQTGLLRSTGTIAANGLGSPPSEGGVAASADGVVEGKGGTITISAPWAGLGGTISADGATQGGRIAVNAGGLSLADRVSATSPTGKGGDISFNVARKSWEIAGSVVDVSGASGGTITHVAGQQITTSGTYLATGAIGSGGRVDMTAPAVKLLSSQFDASGQSVGGSVRIGGEYQGGKTLTIDELPNAQLLAVNDGVRIRADGRGAGAAGGSVVLWADQKAAVYGDISAQPGAGGAGGSIEISSGDALTFGGMASAGAGGIVLFDPKNITIGPATGSSQYTLVLGYNYNNIPGIDGANLEAGDSFGTSVALNATGDRLAVGAAGDAGAGNVATLSGAVHLFTFTDGSFSGGTLAGTLGKGYTGGKNVNVPSLEAGDGFGTAVALNAAGDRLAVGAHLDAGAGNVASGSGAVHLFTFTDSSFSDGALGATIGKGYTGGNNVDVTSLEAGDFFGRAVALNAAGDRLAVGAHGDDGAGNVASFSGAVRLFTFTDGSFSGGVLAGTLGLGYTGGKNVNVASLTGDDQFGNAVALNAAGDRLAVGTFLDDGAGDVVSGSGAVHLFTFTDGSFSGGVLAGTIGTGYTGGKNINVPSLEAFDRFGSAVALNATGDRLAVGAYLDDGASNLVADSGAMHLFTFTDTSFSGGALAGTLGKSYTGGKNVNVANLEGGDQFGWSAALNATGDRVVVGAPIDAGAGNVASSSGAVHLFTFTDGSFSGGALAGTMGLGYTGGKNVNVSSLEASDRFGVAVALNAAGDRLAVGANQDAGAGNVASGSGAVHLFTFSDGSFSGGALAGTMGLGYTGGKNVNVTSLEAGDFFGFAVALNATGDRLAVGAIGDAGAGNVASASGAVHLFTFTDGSFSGGALAGTLGLGYTGGKNVNVASLEANDRFGAAVALNATGDRLAVGAYGDGGAGNVVIGSGAVHLFTFTDGSFSGGVLAGTIGNGYTGGKNVDVSSLEIGDIFGYSVALNATGDRLAVGAVNDAGAGNVASSSGAVRLFTFTDSSFSGGALAGTIGKGYTGGNNVNVSSLEAGDVFGNGVALNAAGDRLAVGANGDFGAGNVASNSGAVHLFTFTDGSFSGGALAGTLGLGYTGGKNVNVASLEAVDVFGYAVALNATGDRLAVGAEGDSGAGNVASFSGAVHLFTFTDTSFSGGALAGTIGLGYTGGKNVNVASLEAGDFFGSAVALNATGDRLAVGALGDDGAGNVALDSGAVRLFTFTDGSFSGGALAGTLGAGYTGGKNVNVASLEVADNFGVAVALNATGDRLAVAAYNDSGAGNVASFSGAVHLFTFTDGSFSGGALAGTLGTGYTGGNNVNVAGLEAADNFGVAVALNATGDRLAVGAYFDAGAGNLVAASGAVHLFTFTDGSFSGGALAGTLGAGYTGGNNVNVAGLEAGDRFGRAVALNATGDRLAVGAPSDAGAGNVAGDSGAVYFFNLAGGGGNAVAGATFANDAGLDYTITPASITAITNTGSSVVLQANNDITLAASSPITTSASGAGGAITMQAGRSISVNSSITTDNGHLTLTANDPAALLANRDAGAGGISVNSGVAISTGTGNVTLNAGTGGNLDIVGATVSGQNINLSGANINIGSAAPTALTSVSSIGLMTVNAANNLTLRGADAGTGIGAELLSSAGQNISAKSIQVTSSGDNQAVIGNTAGDQMITVNNLNSGGGIDVRSSGLGTSGFARIINSGTGAQSITVNDGDLLSVRGQAGDARIEAAGNQTVLMQGAASNNSIVVGSTDGLDASGSGIIGHSQSITAGTGTQNGSIALHGGASGALGGAAFIDNRSGNQTIAATGAITLTGGTGPVSGACNAGGCAWINSLFGQQSISANSLTLQGGNAGSGNWAVISSVQPQLNIGAGGLTMQGGGGISDNGAYILADATGGTFTLNVAGTTTLTGGSSTASRALIGSLFSGQNVTVNLTGAGNITLTGGSTTNTEAVIKTTGTGTQTITASSGGVIALQGGSGTDAYASLRNDGAAQFITALGITLTGGASGTGNGASIRSAGSQSIEVGAGGLTQIAGGGGATDGDNYATVYQAGTAGTSQIITVNDGGSIIMQGGSSGATNVGNFHGSRAQIQADGDSQLINFTNGGTMVLTGGTVGSRNRASIHTQNGTQTIMGSPVISLTGGANGGIPGEGNVARIRSVGDQTITASGIMLTGGTGGTDNIAKIEQTDSTANQTITITGGGAIALQGGDGTNNYARTHNNGTAQTIDFTSGGSLTLTGGTGVSDNFAQLRALTGTQTITGSPTIALTGGASGGLPEQGNDAMIRADVGLQTIAAGPLTLLGGLAGANNFAGIQAPIQDITVSGDLVLTGRGGTDRSGARIGGLGGLSPDPTNLTLDVTGNITLTGGSTGGVGLGTNSIGGQTTDLGISAGGNITLTPGAPSALPVRIGSPPANIAGGNVSVTAGGGIALNSNAGVGTSINTLDNVTLIAGGAISEGVDSSIRANALTTASSTGAALSALNQVSALTATNTGTNGIQFTNAPAALLTINSIAQSGGNVVITADDLNITGAIDAGANTVTLRPTTLTQNINIESTPTVGVMSLAPTEIQNVTAGTLEIGRTDGTGNLNLTAALANANVNAATLRLVSGGDINLSTAAADIGSLATPLTRHLELGAKNDVNVSDSSIYVGDNRNLTIIADSDSSGVGNVYVGAVTVQVGSGVGNTTGSMSMQGRDISAVASGGGSTTVKVEGAGTQSFTASNQILFSNSTGGVMSVTTAGGLQSFDTSAATGSGDMIVRSSPSGLGIGNVFVGATGSGSQNLALAGGFTVESLAGGNASAQAIVGGNFLSAQSVTAKFVEVLAGGSAGAFIVSNTGPQSVTTTGTNSSGRGVSIVNTGSASDVAAILYGGLVSQSITVNNADSVRVLGLGGNAKIESFAGNQTIVLQGAGQNRLELGDAAAVGESVLIGFNQSVTAGMPGQAGGITLIGGQVDGRNSSIFTSSSGTSQNVSTSGTISATGGTSAGPEGADAGIRHNGSGTQVINAQGIVLQGGSAGVDNNGFMRSQIGGQQITVDAGGISLTGGGGSNLAHITQAGPSATQTITVNNGGAIALQGGSGTGAFARIRNDGVAQAINFTAGGNLTLTGGTGVSDNFAQLRALTGTQTITGSPTITLTGGASGGLPEQGNDAMIRADVGLQTIAAGPLTLLGGLAGANNFAGIQAPIQDITVSGDLVLTGRGGTDRSGARIGGLGGLSAGPTDLTLDVTGNITLTGGSTGGVGLGTNSIGGQTTDLGISAGGNIPLTPGAPSALPVRIGSPPANIAGGNISVTAGGGIALNSNAGVGTSINTLDNVTLVAGGAISEGVDSSIRASGLTSTSSTGTVLAALNQVSALTATNATANGIQFTNAAGTPLIVTGISQSGGDLTLNANGAITQTGAITVAGASSFNAGANPITLTNAGNDFTGAVSLNNSGANNVALTDANAIVLGTSSVGTGTLTVNAIGANTITQTGPIVQAPGAGVASFQTGGGAITLTHAANDFTGPIDANAGSASVAITDANSLILLGGASGSGGDYTYTANGLFSQSGALTGSVGNVVINAGIGPVVLTDAGNNFAATSLAVNTTGAASLVNNTAINLGASSIGGAASITAGGAVTQSGAVVVGGTATVNAGSNAITLTNSGNDFTGAVALNNSGANNVAITDANAIALAASSVGSGTLTVTSAGISQTGAITQAAGAGAALFDAGTGAVTLTDPNNSLTGALSLTGSSVSISSANSFTLGAINSSSLTVNAVGISQSAPLTVSGTATFNAGVGPITLTDANDFGTVVLSNSGANNVAITDINAIVLNGVTTSGAFSVSAGGAITQTAPIVVGGASSFSAGAGSLTLTASGNSFGGAVSLNTSGANDAAISYPGTLSLGASNVGGNLTASASGDLSLSGGSTVGGSASLSASNDVNLNAGLSVGNDLILSAVSRVRVNEATVSAGDTLNVSSAFLDITAASSPARLQAGTDLNVTTGAVTLLGGSANNASAELRGGPGTFSIATSGNVGLSGGSGTGAFSRIFGDPDANMTVGGVIQMNAGSGAGAFAVIEAASATSINITFPNLVSGGYFVNGVEGTVFDLASGSGFIAGGLPAVPGLNFNISYTLAPAIEAALLTPLLSAQIAGTEQAAQTMTEIAEVTTEASEEETQASVAAQADETTQKPALLLICR